MTADPPNILPPDSTGDWRSIGLSLLIHVMVLVTIGLLWTSRTVGGGDEQARRVEIVLATSDQEPEYLERADMEPVEASGDNAAASAIEMLPASDTPPIDTSQMLDDVAPLDLPVPGLDSTAMARPDSRPGSPRNMQLTPEQQEMLAAERAAFEARRPRGPATSLSVFGSGELTGRKFVFVIDRSKSMGGQGLNVLAAAADELGGAVESLKEYHQFQIVAYHHQTLSISRRALLNATEDAKSQVTEFINNLAAFGGTAHEAALVTALAMNPDVVVLLTDGGLPELNAAQLRRIKRAAGGTQVHCVQFGFGPQQDLNTFMRNLAAQNSGTYRYVDVSQWNDPGG